MLYALSAEVKENSPYAEVADGEDVSCVLESAVFVVHAPEDLLTIDVEEWPRSTG